MGTSVYFTSLRATSAVDIDECLKSRASSFYRLESEAKAIAEDQNRRAEELGIKARYAVHSCHDTDMPYNERSR